MTDHENPEDEAKAIARQNDLFRRSFGTDARVPGRFVMTQGIEALGEAVHARLIAAVRAFEAFTPDNDPHGQHDFGAVEIDGTRVWFKIDLYDPDYTYGSDAPANTARTRRVLTLLLPSEY